MAVPATRNGARHRTRLHRGGNRKLNSAFHRIAITQLRDYPPAKDYISLERHLVRTIYNTMTPTPDETPTPVLALT